MNRKIKKAIAFVAMCSCISATSYTSISYGLTNESNEISYTEDELNGWIYKDGYYYYYIDGEIQINWLKDGSNWYWLKSDGVMASDEWISVEGREYRFNSSGRMLNDEWYKDTQENWYWLKSHGAVATNEWIAINGRWYRFDENGIMLENEWYKDSRGDWYWLKSHGAMSSNEWVMVNGRWYRFNESGIMLENEWYQDANGDWYWLKPYGSMASNETLTISGKSYKFDASGKMIDERQEKIDNIVELAHEQIGKPYSWGANGPNSFDCSGLTSYVYKNGARVTIPRTSREQSKAGKTVSKSELEEGDLLFFNTSGSGVSHVGVYIGESKMIHSPSTGKNVKIENINSNYYTKTFVTAKRIIE